MWNKMLAFSAMTLCGMWGGTAMPHAARAADSAVMSKSDTDENETLDLDEVKLAAGARFDKLKKNGDGTLESIEVEGVDRDNHGGISKDQYLALVEKLFNDADADHDGSLTVEELKSPSGRQLKKLID